MKTLRNTAEIGAYGEKIAVRYLRLRGYAVKSRNWRTGHMELDIIAENLRDVAFVEVKTRTYNELSEVSRPPKSAVNAEKQRLTRQAARRYLAHYPTRKQPRMDVLEVFLLRRADTDKYKVAKIHHIKAAY